MTKPINEMTLEELAAYAVTLEGWDWTLVSGAKDRYGFRLFAGPDSHVLTAEQAKEWDWAEYGPGRVMNVSCAASYLEEYKLENGIDLNDPATLGCVLKMCRKRISQWFYVEPVRGGGGYVGKVPFLGAPPVTDDMPTEAHALIAALAKEVAK